MARFKFWIDIAADIVTPYNALSATLVTKRVYLLSGDDNRLLPEIKRFFGGYKKFSGRAERQLLLEAEPFSTIPEGEWNRGHRMIIEDVLLYPNTWVVGSNLPEHVAFLQTLNGFEAGDADEYGLTVMYTSAVPWACIAGAWQRSLDKANAIETWSVTLDERGGGI